MARKAKATSARPPAQPQTIYQFKISLKHIRPPIWRRIQVPDGTLDQLHEHIQAAMGWENAHLHHFLIDKQRFGDPSMLESDWDDNDFIDSTSIRLSELLEKRPKKFKFMYEYDFGDGWLHEIVFEGESPADPKGRYPRCIAGARACPPEDCGGPWGYGNLLDAIRDPKHKDHETLVEWIGDDIDSETFDPDEATKAMKRGLPDWRD
jgi:hypothetical protein